MGPRGVDSGKDACAAARDGRGGGRGGRGERCIAGRYAAALRSSPSFTRLSQRTQERHLSMLWMLTAALGRDVEWMLGNCGAAFREILSVERENGRCIAGCRNPTACCPPSWRAAWSPC